MEYRLIDQRYQILDELGKGGMGIVFQVRDLVNNTILALKTLPGIFQSANTLNRFKREFQTIVSLDHQHLVHVYDFGVDELNVPFFTMEYIEGWHLDRFSHSLDQKIFLSLMMQVCDALAYIHSRGLVHRDIKPTNIMIRRSRVSGTKAFRVNEPGFEVVLTDFGLAVQSREMNLDKPGGTFVYMAPEVLQSESVTALSDLYALGVVMYRTLTGILPYAPEASYYLPKASATYLPVEPATINRDIPRQLSELVLRMIAQDPQLRPSDARTVRDELSAIRDQLIEGIDRVREFRRELYQSNFIGRTQILQELYASFEMMISGKSRILAISGESGIGKTRLLKEFKQYVQLNGHVVFMADFPVTQKASYKTLNGIFDSLTHYVLSRNPELIRRYLPYLVTLNPKLKESFPAENLETLPTLDAEAERIRFQDGISRFVVEVSRTIPLIIVIDNLHYAPMDDLSTILSIVRHNIQGRYLFLFTHAPEATFEHGHLHQFTESLASMETLRRMSIPRFSLEQSSLVVTSILGSTIENEELQRLVFNKTAGNPFFIFEYLHQLIAGGGLVSSAQGWEFKADVADAVQVPTSIQDALLSKLISLPSNKRKPLDYAVVAGREFSLDILGETGVFAEAELQHFISWASKAGLIIRPQNGESPNCFFSQASLQEKLYGEIPRSRRRKIHRQLAASMEKRCSLQPFFRGECALHHIYGGDLERGMPLLVDYIQFLFQTYSYEQVIDICRQVIRILDSVRIPGFSPQKQQLLVFLRNSSIRLGQFDEALAANGKLLRLLRQPIEKSECLYYAADIQFKRNNVKAAIGFLKKAEQALPPDNLSRHSGQMKLLQADILSYRGKHADAAIVCRNAIEEFRKLNERQRLAEGFNSLGKIYSALGDISQAIAFFSRAMKLYRRIDDRFGQAAALNNLAVTLFDLGKWAEAIAQCEKCLSMNREIGNLRGLAKNFTNLASFYFSLFDASRVISYQNQGLVIFEQIGDLRGKGVALNNLAMAHRMQGNFNDCEHYLLESIELKRKAGDISFLISGYHNLGQHYLTRRDFTHALQKHKMAYLMARKSESVPLLAASYAYLAEDYLVMGDYVRAERYLKSSFELTRHVSYTDFLFDNYKVATQLHLYRGEWKEARKNLECFLDIARRRGNPHLEGIGMRLQAELLYNTGQQHDAHIWYERAVAQFQRIQNHYELAITYKKFGEFVYLEFPEKAKPLLQEAYKLFEELSLSYEKREIKRLLDEIDRRLLGSSRPDRNLEILIEASKAMISIPDLDQLLNYFVDKALLISNAQRGFLVLLDEKYRLQTRVIRQFSEEELTEQHRFSHSIIQEVLLQQMPLYIRDTLSDGRYNDKSSIADLDIRSVIAVPLLLPKLHTNLSDTTEETHVTRDLIGVVYLDSQVQQHAFTEYDLNSVVVLANSASFVILNSNLFRLATVDALTRTYIYRYFQQRLKEELLRASRFQRHLSLLMIDIDHFKDYNDKFGHQAGNIVLRTIAHDIKSMLRTSDILCRYGGEEFVLIMPETDARGALIVAEKIRTTIEANDQFESPITISIGIASFPEHEIKGRGDFIEKADYSLYQAKILGRNRSIMFNPLDLNTLTKDDGLIIPQDFH